MQHLDDAQFVDYVRGLLSSAEQASLQQHLVECAACSKVLKCWQMFRETASADAAVEPDPIRVKTVKAMFALYRPQTRLKGAVMLDTVASMIPGIRSAGIAPRQVAYQSGNYTVDLRLSQKDAANRYNLVGQILDKRDPYGISYMPVVFSSGTKQPLRGCTNRFGEFEFDVEFDGDAVLTIALDECSAMDLPISIEQGINTGRTEH